MKTKEFKKGDKVKYTREPTEDDWKDIGEADIPFKLGDVLEVYSGSSKSVRFENYGYFYPTVCFELQEDITNLTGRYVKALVDNANCINCKIGDLFLVTDDNNIYTHITRLSDGQPNWNLSKSYLGTEWELMPKDFNPNKSEEPFTIQLHSQEELDAIMSFYKEKGYKMQGNSDYYDEYYVVHIKPENKTWQTAVFNSENYPFKTLSELGITVNTTPQFEVNRWYKANLEERVFYLKLLKQEKNKIWASEQISVKTSSFAKEPTLCFDDSVNYKTDRYELLTDLSEIQKYLPLGHPDLIVNNNSMYKVGDFVTDDNGINVYKYGKFENDRHYPMSWGVYADSKRKVDPNFSFGTNLRKAKLEEIKTDLLSEDELLQVAKQFYPIGTSFLSFTYDNTICKITKSDFLFCNKNLLANDGATDHDGKFSILKNGKWAKIINSPIQESDNFVLPEKWCIKLKNNYDIINKWGKDYWENITGWGNLSMSQYMLCSFKDKICTSSNNTNEYTEITFDQFKKYVLNKSKVVKENGSGLTTKAEKVRSNYGNPTFHEDSFEYEYKPLVESKSSKKLTSPKIIPIKVRNCNITETKSTRTRVKIIKKSII